MINTRPRLNALKKAVKKVISASTTLQRRKAIEDFNGINEEGWHSCAIGSFLNDCGINVKQIASCRGTSNGEVVRALVKQDLVDEGGQFEHNVYKNKQTARKALSLLDKLITTKPCQIMKV